MTTSHRRRSLICLGAVAVVVLLSVSSGLTVATAPGTENECRIFGTNGQPMYLAATDQTRIAGALATPSDANLTAVLRFPGAHSDTVLRNDSVRRAGDQWFATFDLSKFARGRTFVATLQRDGEVVEATEGVIGTPTATVTFRNQTPTLFPDREYTKGYVTVQQVQLDLGGFVAIHLNDSHGPVVALSPYLRPGTHTDVHAELAMTFNGATRMAAVAHVDSDCDRRFDYVTNEPDDYPFSEYAPQHGNDSASATVQFPTATPTPPLFPSETATVTPSPTPTPTATSESPTSGPATRSDTQTATAETTPGAGIVVALLSLLCVAVFLWVTR